MLRDEVGDPLRQSDLFRESRSVGDVTRDDLRALVWTQTIVRVVALLVFDEVLGRCEFADIVIERADACEQWIRPDRTTSVFRKLADRMRMLVRAGRTHRELTQHRQIGVGKFQQFDVSKYAEER